MADGTKIANSAEFRKLINNMAREITPVSTVLNSGSGNPISAMEDRKTYIESIMGTSSTPRMKNSGRIPGYSHGA